MESDLVGELRAEVAELKEQVAKCKCLQVGNTSRIYNQCACGDVINGDSFLCGKCSEIVKGNEKGAKVSFFLTGLRSKGYTGDDFRQRLSTALGRVGEL